MHYLLFPSLYSEYVYTGTSLRLGFYLLLLVGAAREIRSYWELRLAPPCSRTAGGWPATSTTGWPRSCRSCGASPERWPAAPGRAAVERIGGAAARALDEARRAIAALTRPLDEPFARVLQQVADDLGSRYDVKVVSTLEPDVEVAPRTARRWCGSPPRPVRNAVRHGGAEQIDLVPHRRAAVPDDHRRRTGFTAAPDTAGRGGGFGLTSMRERARAIGAEFSVTSAPGQGTTVRVTRR